MKRVVDVVQVLALVATAAFVVLLFANEPADAPSLGAVSGEEVYAGRCAGCHGAAGAGGVGPSLVDVAERMSEAEEIAVVSDGRGRMPAWGDRLSADEIAAVVAYTRADLPGR